MAFLDSATKISTHGVSEWWDPKDTLEWKSPSTKAVYQGKKDGVAHDRKRGSVVELDGVSRFGVDTALRRFSKPALLNIWKCITPSRLGVGSVN